MQAKGWCAGTEYANTQCDEKKERERDSDKTKKHVVAQIYERFCNGSSHECIVTGIISRLDVIYFTEMVFLPRKGESAELRAWRGG